MSASRKSLVLILVSLLAAGLLAWSLYGRFSGQGGAKKRARAQGPAPVETAPVFRGPIELRRTYSGTLEAASKFAAAPKVSGRVVKLNADIGDTIKRGQVVAELDDAEYVQAVAQATADLLVARANQVKATNALTIANRDYARASTLRKRGVASEAQLDEAKSRQQAAEAEHEVAKAQRARAESALATARIRLGYTKVAADWSGGGDTRIVAERKVDEGDTVAANAPLLTIVELQPIVGVFFVAERDYALLKPGQRVSLLTDAYPGRIFRGSIERISPVFQMTTRQARVEITIPNRDKSLKPGMFAKVSVVLKKVANAEVVSDLALADRNDQKGVFVLGPGGKTVVWRPVRLGIRSGGRVQVSGLAGAREVVVLGQHLIRDGSAVVVRQPGKPRPAPGAGRK